MTGRCYPPLNSSVGHRKKKRLKSLMLYFSLMTMIFLSFIMLYPENSSMRSTLSFMTMLMSIWTSTTNKFENRTRGEFIFDNERPHNCRFVSAKFITEIVQQHSYWFHSNNIHRLWEQDLKFPGGIRDHEDFRISQSFQELSNS